MGNSSTKSTDIGKHSLTITANDNTEVLSATAEKKLTDLQFLYFTYKIPIKSLLGKPITVIYTNYIDKTTKEYNLFLNLDDVTLININNKKIYELTYYNNDHNIKFRYDDINNNTIDIIYNITINYNLPNNIV